MVSAIRWLNDLSEAVPAYAGRLITPWGVSSTTAVGVGLASLAGAMAEFMRTIFSRTVSLGEATGLGHTA